MVALLALSSCSAAAEGGEPTAVDRELAAVLEELRGDQERFGVLFGRYDGTASVVHVAGEIEPDDHLRLASVSKVFLAYVFLREGLDPDATIDAWYPADRHPQANAITARMLLSHTSGIPDEMGRRLQELGEGADPATVLASLQDVLAMPAPPPDERIRTIYNPEVGLDFEPGTRWCYSNPGFMMLGRILERSTGEAIETLLAKHLGEVAPSFYLDDGREAGFPGSYPRPWPIHWSQPWIAGSTIARAGDALAALHYIAEQPEFERMQEWVSAPRCPADVVAGDEYGLGLQRYALDGLGEAIGHDGHIGARTMLFRIGNTTYLVHTTAPVENPQLREVARRVVAAQRGS